MSVTAEQYPCLNEAAQAAAPAAASIPLSSRLPSLDGWRALSILMVLGEHTMHSKAFPEEMRPVLTQFCDGHLGVRFFFVLSGFLITWLMLSEERRSGTVNLKHFFARRALRILPVYIAFLAVLAILQATTPFHQSVSAWFGSLTFTRNWFYDHHSSNHLWSISVEEQFYLLWPACFVFFKPQASWKKCITLLTSMVVLAVINRIFVYYHPVSPPGLAGKLQSAIFGNWSFFNNADTLAIGCVLAVLLSRERQRVSSFVTSHSLTVPALGLLLLFAPPLLHLQQLQAVPMLGEMCDAIDVCTGRTLQSLGFALLMLQSVVAPRMPLYQILNFGNVSLEV
ncbi:MAG: hypothetical protein B7Z55_02610, partial [Planctomycetales bacterium 12-60-4]